MGEKGFFCKDVFDVMFFFREFVFWLRKRVGDYRIIDFSRWREFKGFEEVSYMLSFFVVYRFGFYACETWLITFVLAGGRGS